MTTGTLHLPRLGETMEEGRIVSWLVAPGERFERGDPLIEVETDKTVVEFPALGAGTLAQTLVEAGASVAVGAAIATIDVGDGPDWTAEDGGAAPAPEAASAAPASAAGMVTVDLPMPRLGETMEEGVVIGWLVAEGASFKRGDPLLEVETDKTVAEFPALTDGRLVATIGEAGKTYAVGATIARVEVAAADRATIAGDAAGEPEAAKPPAAAPKAESAPAVARKPGERVRATPLARRIARQNGIDIAALAGSGRRGRVERADVEAALNGEARAPAGERTGAGFFEGIAYREDGPANGTPFLLIHGFAADSSAWAGLMAGMRNEACRTVAIDMPAHGATTSEASAPDALAKGLDRFAGAIFGAPMHVVAHSLGAVAAVALARTVPVASLTLIAPAGLGLTVDATFIHGLANAGSAAEVGFLLDRMTDGPVGLSPQRIAEIEKTLARGRLKSLAEAFAGPSGQRVNIRADLGKLAEEVPVRLIVGHRDRIVDWREAVDVSPRIAIHHIPRAGHMPQWEAMADVLAILKLVKGTR